MSEILSKIFNPAVMPDSSQIREDWRIVAKGAALYAAMAIEAKDWVKTQQALQIRENARQRGGLDAALLAAIFGGEIPPVPDNRLNRALILEGHNATAEAIANAEAVVAGYLQAKAEAKAERQVQRREESRENARRIRAEREAKRPAREAEKAAKAEAKAAAEAAKDEATQAMMAKIARMGDMVEKVGSMVSVKDNHGAIEAEIKTILSEAGIRVSTEFGHMTTRLDVAGYKLGLYVDPAENPADYGIYAFVYVEKSTPATVAYRAAAEKEARVAALLAAGAIIVDGVVLTEDGQEILIEEV